MINFDFNKKCYGCAACKNICPKKAISMVDDKDGFLIPHINKDLCVDCGLCEKVCPRLSKEKNQNHQPLKCMYIFKKELDDGMKKSASSGIAYELAKLIINDGGYVCGCIWDNMVAKHVVTNDLEILEKMRGSKYVQSDVQCVYKEIEKIIKSNKKVIFFGMACQIKGLKNYLKKDYSNIYYVQIICHGNPSPKVFEKYKNYLERKYNKKVSNINFRCKEKGGWLTPNPVYYFDDNTKLEMISDPYSIGFGKSLFDRLSCSSCQMKNDYNIADIIIGDALGMSSKQFLKSKNKGASSLIINSSKGNDLFSMIESLYDNKFVSLAEISKENSAIFRTYKVNKNRNEYINRILSNDAFPINEFLGKKAHIKKILYRLGLLSFAKKIRYLIKHM